MLSILTFAISVDILFQPNATISTFSPDLSNIINLYRNESSFSTSPPTFTICNLSLVTSRFNFSALWKVMNDKVLPLSHKMFMSTILPFLLLPLTLCNCNNVFDDLLISDNPWNIKPNFWASSSNVW